MKKMAFSRRVLKQAAGWALSAMVLAVGFSGPVRQLGQLPDKITLTEGEATRLEFMVPIGAEVQGAGAQVLSSLDEHLDEGGSQVELTAQSSGSAEVVLKLMGLPIKTVNVTVAPEKRVAPGGQSIGIALNMDGVLVVGASDVGVQPSPARMAGLRSGDLIVKVNGARIDSADQLSQQIARGNEAALEVMRAGKAVNVSIDPVKDERDGAYRLGAWVRDSTAGVGTLSFYDPETNCLAALGHAITDADTGTILTVSVGDIYESRVIGVMKGLEGEPGELLGDFIRDKAHMGAVSVNSVYGIYGKSDQAVVNPLYPNGVRLLSQEEVREGPALLLTTLDAGGVKAYKCEISKCFAQNGAGQRGMIVKITDEALLQATGGIVQGMSGSPLIQNGALAGAVTHVFLNDPTQGYGMYAQWMIDEAAATDAA
ncbi:MAG: SpoIVB peptidase [Clostridia bacterium]